MRRWIVRILLCLIFITGGAITTVAVAWGFTWSLDMQPVPTQYGTTASPFTHDSGVQLNEWLNVMRWDSVGSLRLYISGMRETPSMRTEVTYRKPRPAAESVLPDWVDALPPIWCFDSTGLQSDYASQVFRADGWPWLAMMGRAHVVSGPSSAAVWEFVNAYELDSPARSRGPRLLPRLPIWPGFLIDTLFYGAIWFAVFFGFASAKRAIRRKRGRCPRCGYDLRGNLSAGCPECGWQREENAA